MAAPLIATKLHAPSMRPGHVRRPQLVARLRRSADTQLTLISAPAGFGKTTLLAEWLAARSPRDRKLAWLSLDQTDRDPTSFWAHVVAAVAAAVPGFGAENTEALGAGQAGDAFVATVVNELNALSEALDLVLDDFHVIESAEIQAGVAFLVEHLSAQVHLVISTRADPAFPLARLRVRGLLVEVRAADLRFDHDEAAAYLNDEMGLDLAGDDLAALTERTEGWIAALQLAALSLKDRDDASGFIAAFSGNDRYIVDYLVEEVLARLPADIRDFLQHTCHLDRLSASLADAVRDAGDSRVLLRTLDDANLFLIPLDDRREWFRYHHLFADVLRAHFSGEAGAPLIHRRACDWYAAHGESPAAIAHALAAEDFSRAAELIELAVPKARQERNEAQLLGWLQALPEDMVERRPVLAAGLAGVLASLGRIDQIEGWLAHAERGLADPDAVVVDREQFAALPGAIELYRSVLTQVRGDLPGTIAHARKSLALALPDDHLGRAAASGFLGIAHWTTGDLAAATDHWTACREGLQRAGHVADVRGASLALADIFVARGRLREAERVLRDALALDPSVRRGAPDVLVGLADIHLQRNELAAAHEHFARAEELGERLGLPQHAYRWRATLAKLREIEGDFAAALALLDEAERVYVGDFFPAIRPIPAVRARLRIAQGDLEAARHWQRDAGVDASDELSYLREYGHITLARLQLAEGETDTLPFLDRLRQAASSGGRYKSVVEIDLLIALAQHAAGHTVDGIAALERALKAAQPEGLLRLFVDDGRPLLPLLKSIAKRRDAPDFARKVLAALEADAGHPAPARGLIEALSERELDVLRLLRGDLGGPEIARELAVSLNTMRTHTKKIYEKLGVGSRRAAVRRAEELKLF